MDPELYVLIIAGGRGTRFWPRSRRKLPKQCISLDGHATLIQRTLKRVLPLVRAQTNGSAGSSPTPTTCSFRS